MISEQVLKQRSLSKPGLISAQYTRRFRPTNNEVHHSPSKQLLSWCITFNLSLILWLVAISSSSSNVNRQTLKLTFALYGHPYLFQWNLNLSFMAESRLPRQIFGRMVLREHAKLCHWNGHVPRESWWWCSRLYSRIPRSASHWDCFTVRRISIINTIQRISIFLLSGCVRLYERVSVSHAELNLSITHKEVEEIKASDYHLEVLHGSLLESLTFSRRESSPRRFFISAASSRIAVGVLPE